MAGFLAALIWAAPAAGDTNNATGIQACDGNTCTYQESVPIGTGILPVDEGPALVCTAPIRIPLGDSGDEVAVCERDGGEYYGAHTSLVRVRSGENEVAVETVTSLGSTVTYKAVGIRVGAKSARVASECRWGPEDGSECAPFVP